MQSDDAIADYLKAWSVELQSPDALRQSLSLAADTVRSLVAERNEAVRKGEQVCVAAGNAMLEHDTALRLLRSSETYIEKVEAERDEARAEVATLRAQLETAREALREIDDLDTHWVMGSNLARAALAKLGEGKS